MNYIFTPRVKKQIYYYLKLVWQDVRPPNTGYILYPPNPAWLYPPKYIPVPFPNPGCTLAYELYVYLLNHTLHTRYLN